MAGLEGVENVLPPSVCRGAALYFHLWLREFQSNIGFRREAFGLCEAPRRRRQRGSRFVSLDRWVGCARG